MRDDRRLFHTGDFVMTEQILLLIIILIGFGVMFGGATFIRRIVAMISGCLQFILIAAIVLLLFALVVHTACSGPVGR
jgi:uncharacterized membrane protein required for colicin V production